MGKTVNKQLPKVSWYVFTGREWKGVYLGNVGKGRGVSTTKFLGRCDSAQAGRWGVTAGDKWMKDSYLGP